MNISPVKELHHSLRYNTNQTANKFCVCMSQYSDFQEDGSGGIGEDTEIK